jgi:hypothetical protein
MLSLHNIWIIKVIKPIDDEDAVLEDEEEVKDELKSAMAEELHVRHREAKSVALAKLNAIEGFLEATNSGKTRGGRGSGGESRRRSAPESSSRRRSAGIMDSVQLMRRSAGMDSRIPGARGSRASAESQTSAEPARGSRIPGMRGSRASAESQGTQASAEPARGSRAFVARTGSRTLSAEAEARLSRASASSEAAASRGFRKISSGPSAGRKGGPVTRQESYEILPLDRHSESPTAQQEALKDAFDPRASPTSLKQDLLLQEGSPEEEDVKGFAADISSLSSSSQAKRDEIEISTSFEELHSHLSNLDLATVKENLELVEQGPHAHKTLLQSAKNLLETEADDASKKIDETFSPSNRGRRASGGRRASDGHSDPHSSELALGSATSSAGSGSATSSGSGFGSGESHGDHDTALKRAEQEHDLVGGGEEVINGLWTETQFLQKLEQMREAKSLIDEHTDDQDSSDAGSSDAGSDSHTGSTSASDISDSEAFDSQSMVTVDSELEDYTTTDDDDGVDDGDEHGENANADNIINNADDQKPAALSLGPAHDPVAAAETASSRVVSGSQQNQQITAAPRSTMSEGLPESPDFFPNTRKQRHEKVQKRRRERKENEEKMQRLEQV